MGIGAHSEVQIYDAVAAVDAAISDKGAVVVVEILVPVEPHDGVAFADADVQSGIVGGVDLEMDVHDAVAPVDAFVCVGVVEIGSVPYSLVHNAVAAVDGNHSVLDGEDVECLLFDAVAALMVQAPHYRQQRVASFRSAGAVGGVCVAVLGEDDVCNNDAVASYGVGIQIADDCVGCIGFTTPDQNAVAANCVDFDGVGLIYAHLCRTGSRIKAAAVVCQMARNIIKSGGLEYVADIVAAYHYAIAEIPNDCVGGCIVCYIKTNSIEATEIKNGVRRNRYVVDVDGVCQVVHRRAESVGVAFVVALSIAVGGESHTAIHRKGVAAVD